MSARINQPTKFIGVATPLERARDVNFGKRLKKLITEQNRTASDVAGEIWGRHKPSSGKKGAKGRDRLSVWINGKAFPDHENLIKLASALKCKVSDLAPDAELRAANRATPKWSMVASDEYPGGAVFVQIAQLLPPEAAEKIFAVLRSAAAPQALTANKG